MAKKDILLDFFFTFSGEEIYHAFGNTVGLDVLKNSRIKADIQLSCNSGNKERSDEKVASAKRAIRKLMEDGERISVPQLMKMTGLSRGFFYKNAIVRAEIDRAMEQQAGTVDPRRSILDQAMDSRIELLQQQIAELKRENAILLIENQRLQKALNKKSLNIIKNL